MRAWRARYGAAPSSYDWSRTHARRRGGEALKRLQAGEWPAPSTVIDLHSSWATALADVDAFGGVTLGALAVTERELARALTLARYARRQPAARGRND